MVAALELDEVEMPLGSRGTTREQEGVIEICPLPAITSITSLISVGLVVQTAISRLCEGM